jgi:hypothetical protein
MKVLHLWAGAAFHERGYIEGNKEGLEALRDTINDALMNADKDLSISSSNVSTADGEGYTINVLVTKDTDRLALPYTASFAVERRFGIVYPWQKVVYE